jgi:hypothetical protein
MAGASELNFIQQQGLGQVDEETYRVRFFALMFQPKIVGLIVVLGLIFQTWPLFLTLAAVLWWNALVPSRNPFDALYNCLIAIPRSLPHLVAAPAPRRFAQGMAGTFMLAVGVFLLAGWHTAAYVVEAMLVVALSALIFGKFCLGSYIYHLLRGEVAFANRTLPWAHNT